ncbi:MAG: cysteine--tRNA ligase [Candidatus Levybacteria bacterium]|nr:cysteine--tRNA ligase [Candidatus Levybacteria bacterium]
MLKLYNSLTRKKEPFVPLRGRDVRMYVCGITPYDTTHLGHAFTYVSFDVLARYLKFKGFKVTYVQNVTDIDDDILKRAKEEGKNWKKLGDFWTKRYLSDMRALNVLPPTHYVKATGSVTTIIHIIRVLLNKGFAYEKNGNVYFEVNKDKEYGKLSRFNKEQMLLISKERGNNPNDPLKKDPLDFVLWQRSKAAEPSWDSPWGPPAGGGRPLRQAQGRPGWHIECSAMINSYLGKQIDPFDELRVDGEHSRTIDIHGGGKDLIFPHHESEIAQSEGFTGKKPFVKYWLHTAMVLCDGEKMSKSLGNLVMISDLLKRYSANTIRWVLLSHHYRLPWEFDESEFLQAKKFLDQVQKAKSLKPGRLGKKISASKYFQRFIHYMDNDLDIPSSLLLITRLAKRILREQKRSDVSELKKTLTALFKVLGFN